MGFLDTLQRQQQAPKSMMGRANFSIQRPSPRVRLDKFKAVLDPMEDRPAPFEGQGFERLTGNPANADVNIDVNADIPMGGEIMENPRQGQGQAEAEVANILAEISGIKGKDYGPRKKGGFKDILLGLGLGALQGAANSDPRGGLGAVLGGAIGGGAAGGIGGAIDGSTDNRMRDRLRLDRLYGDYGQAAKVRDIEQANIERQSRVTDRETDNIRLQKQLERQAAKDAVKAQLDQDKLDFNIETAAKIAVHRDRKLDAEIANDKVKAALEQQKIDELIRNNKVKDENEDNRNATSREKGRGRYATPLSPVTPKTGKANEKSARAYLQAKGLKGDALENAIKTARANGEIQ